MALNPSGVSEAALALRTLFGQHIVGVDENRIGIGSPNQTEDELTGSDQQLNIFVYNAEIAPFAADMHPFDSPTVKLHCLITPFGVADSEGNISAGENELRLMGEVIRVLHENPAVQMKNAEGETYADLQLMLENIDIDKMNKIWSSQAETVYRLSVGCELALVPVTIDPAGKPDAPDISVVEIRNYSKDKQETDPQPIVDTQTPETVTVVRPS